MGSFGVGWGSNLYAIIKDTELTASRQDREIIRFGVRQIWTWVLALHFKSSAWPGQLLELVFLSLKWGCHLPCRVVSVFNETRLEVSRMVSWNASLIPDVLQTMVTLAQGSHLCGISSLIMETKSRKI
jgi:hypothetical protein